MEEDGHCAEVLTFLRDLSPRGKWSLHRPLHGSGQEKYFAENGRHSWFIKLGVHLERVRAMEQLGLAPAILASGVLADGTTLLVQHRIRGRVPAWIDFQCLAPQFALALRKTHTSTALQAILSPRGDGSFRAAGLNMLQEVRFRWAGQRRKVATNLARFVDSSLASLEEQIERFQGGGLAAVHGDVCNANWLIGPCERLYLLDYDSMALDDPALDLGSILWWYYPPAMRCEFLQMAGIAVDSGISERMKVRMALHCLNIILPREYTFDQFSLASFDRDLEDFRAVMSGQENPQGYSDRP